VRDVALAEEAGFDFAVISDHYFPWLEVQGHAPYAWSVLGAAAQATDHLPLMTYVTCPIRRYHPAVVAQKAATMQLLSDGRFTLGLGAGENLNEHVVGGRWPVAGVRHQMLAEAVEIIRALWAGGTVTYRGRHFEVESAKVWDLPEVAPPIGIAVSGPEGCRLAGRQADAMIATEPRAELAGCSTMREAPASPASARSRCRTTPMSRPRSSGRWSSSAGSRVAGGSTPSCRFRRRSRWRPGR
jgi:G6PDH family F420-dependent oxidoreductase